MSDRVVSWLRTAVPALWGSIITWILANATWAPEYLTDWLSSEATYAAVTAAAIAGWYALWRWLEPRLPAWATRLVLGSNSSPVYPANVPPAKSSHDPGSFHEPRAPDVDDDREFDNADSPQFDKEAR